MNQFFVGAQFSPVKDWGNKVISWNTIHPTTNSPQLNGNESKADQKTKVIALYEKTPKQFFNLTKPQN